MRITTAADDAPSSEPRAFAREEFAPPAGPLALLREARVWTELGGLAISGLRTETGPAADRRAVLLIPGFLAGDASMAVLAHWLRRRGHRTSPAGLTRFNADCTRRSMRRIERAAEALAERTGVRVAVIGQSRGGAMAELLAIRRPDVIGGIITLGSPTLAPLATHAAVTGAVNAARALGQLGVPGLMDDDCFHGTCAEEAWNDLQRPFPQDVAYLAVFSRSDGVVDWRACLHPAARHVEIASSHVGMAVNREAYEVIAAELARTAAS